MTKEKYVQVMIDVIRDKGCATRRYIIDYLINNFDIKYTQAETIADEVIESLLKRGIVIRKGRGVYCWAGPP